MVFCCGTGARVIIPFRLQKRLLQELHECRPGICGMKAVARSFVWWPGIDLDVEERTRLCDVCTQTHHSSKAHPLLLRPWPTEPWQAVHNPLFSRIFIRALKNRGCEHHSQTRLGHNNTSGHS